MDLIPSTRLKSWWEMLKSSRWALRLRSFVISLSQPLANRPSLTPLVNFLISSRASGISSQAATPSWPDKLLCNFETKICRTWKWNLPIRYMACSVSRQDERNPVLWLATRAGYISLSRPLRTTRFVPQEKFPQEHDKSFIDQVCSVKMAGYWRRFFASLWSQP